MFRKLMIVGSVVVAAVAAFAATSHAIRANTKPRLRSNLPVANRPAVSLDHGTAITVNNVIGADNLSRFGITNSSYDQARVVARTSAGVAYLIPGSRGACLVFAVEASCGDPGAPGVSGASMLALATVRSGQLVGAGITTDAKHVVTISSPHGLVAKTAVSNGAFSVTGKAPVHPIGLEFAAR
jgi:hypothetical protein